MGSEEGSQRCWALDRLDFGENRLFNGNFKLFAVEYMA